MPHAATMNDELFRALRDDAGMPEAAAAKVAQLIFRQGESAARAEREAGRENFATKVDVANLRAEIPDREAFAAKGDVTVLQTKVKTVEDAIISIDKRFERMDKRLDRMDERLDRMEGRLVRLEEIVIRLDERMNALQSQSSKFFYIFFSLHILTITGLIGLLTRGILWGVAP